MQIHIEGHNSGSNFQISGYSEAGVHQNDWLLLSANLLSPHHHRLLVRKSQAWNLSVPVFGKFSDRVKFLSVSDIINIYYLVISKLAKISIYNMLSIMQFKLIYPNKVMYTFILKH